MLPMVPSQRENMIAWLAARCDPPDYGKLIVYEFPKDKLVFGPFQIEARIQQNTDISQQISLWNQMGSRVIRGHLLVVPIENSILYVSPLYLRAATGQLPELKRVIAAYGDRVVMEETLGRGAGGALQGDRATARAPCRGGPGTAAGPAGPADARAREALAHYDRAIERLKAGDWSGFGTELDALRPLLEALGRPSRESEVTRGAIRGACATALRYKGVSALIREDALPGTDRSMEKIRSACKNANPDLPALNIIGC